MPSLVIKHIEALSPASWSGPGSNTDPVCAALARAIQECDDNLRDDFLAVLPPAEQLEQMSDGNIASLVKDEAVVKMMARFQKGSTALAVLQVGRDVWTAGVGDCEAVVGTKQGDQWTSQVISGPPHNLRTNPHEKQKLQRDHPGEEDIVVAKDRVLGLIAVSRGERILACFSKAKPTIQRSGMASLNYRDPIYVSSWRCRLEYRASCSS